MPIYQSNVFSLMSSISVPSQESELVNFMVKQEGERRSSVCRCLCVAAAQLLTQLFVFQPNVRTGKLLSSP